MRLRRAAAFIFVALCVFAAFLIIGYQLLGNFTLEWEHLSRNVREYIREDLEPYILPEKFCTEKKFLLVVICSKPNGFQARQAIRDTWGQKHNNVSFFFLIGEVDDESLQNRLQVESRLFGDIIQERFVDTYNNLTLKSVSMLKLFTLHCMTAHNFLMKADDDLFLNLPLLLNKLSTYALYKNILLGRVRPDIAPARRPSSKWYMPYQMYPNDTYPDFLCGPGYVMSADIVEKLYHCALEVPLLHTEDVFLTGVCAQRMKIQLANSNLFTCNPLYKHFCHYTSSYTLHYYTADAIREAYQMLKENFCAGYKDFSVMVAWIFFFWW